MTKDDMMKWQVEMFIYSCWLYENDYETVFSDEDFDQHCKLLIGWYDDIPKQFQARVDINRLKTGTSMGLEYLPEDGENALNWFRRVKGFIVFEGLIT